MENSTGIDSSEIATLALLQSRGFGGGFGGGGVGSGGYGGYHAGNQVLAASAHADGTAIGARLENLADSTRIAFDSNQEQIRESRTQEQFSRLSDNQFRAEIRASDQHASGQTALATVEQRLSDQHAAAIASATAVEFRSIDRQRDIERILVDNAKEAAKCCCDTQKLILAEGNETRALALAIEGRGTVAALHEAQSRINQLETINALERGRGRG
jgi:hypothetical protein